MRKDPSQADYLETEPDFLEVATGFYRQHSSMDAIVLECSEFPPFSRALQCELDIPVYGWGTLLDHAYSTVVYRDY